MKAPEGKGKDEDQSKGKGKGKDKGKRVAEEPLIVDESDGGFLSSSDEEDAAICGGLRIQIKKIAQETEDALQRKAHYKRKFKETATFANAVNKRLRVALETNLRQSMDLAELKKQLREYELEADEACYSA